jgi:DNA-binding response OmpR family regulator
VTPPVVLVAEDDPDLLALATYRLERLGYEVLRAADGEEALALAARRTPDLVLLDVMMPRVDGLAAVRALRQRPETARTPVILLSARVQEGDVSAGLEAGADEYMAKPFSPRELGARVEALIGPA